MIFVSPLPGLRLGDPALSANLAAGSRNETMRRPCGDESGRELRSVASRNKIQIDKFIGQLVDKIDIEKFKQSNSAFEQLYDVLTE